MSCIRLLADLDDLSREDIGVDSSASSLTATPTAHVISVIDLASVNDLPNLHVK